MTSRSPITQASPDDHQRQVQELAYHLWEISGRPDGDADTFWYAAISQIERGSNDEGGTSAKKNKLNSKSSPKKRK